MKRLLLILALAACGDSPTGPATLVGSYVLTEVNGSALPAIVYPGGVVSGGTMVLREDGTFTETFRLTNGNDVVETGAYTVSGDAAAFVTYYGYRYTGVIEASTLVSTTGSVWPTRYRRE